MSLSPCAPQFWFVLFLLPQIPHSETLCCASLSLSVTLWLPTCASQWDSVHSGHTTFRPRSLKHMWDWKAVYIFDWPISVHWKWKRYCFGASNDETYPSHGQRDCTATKPGALTSPCPQAVRILMEPVSYLSKTERYYGRASNRQAQLLQEVHEGWARA